MERRLIGEGIEHRAYASRIEGIVLKRPKTFTVSSMLVLRYGPDKLRQEIDEARQEASESEVVRIPKTRVFDFPVRVGRFNIGTSYIVAQEFVKEDGSVPDIQKQLVESDHETWAIRHRRAPSNFISSKGMINLVDSSRSYYRYGERLGFKYEKLMRIRNKVLNLAGLNHPKK